MKRVEYKYFSTGDEIILKCGCKAVFWNGPAFADTRHHTSHIMRRDIYGELKVWNTSIYTKGDTIKNTLPLELLRRLHVIGNNFDLRISNLSLSDEGLFTCDSACGELENRFLLQIICK